MEIIKKVTKGESTNQFSVIAEILNEVRGKFKNVPVDNGIFGASRTIAKESFKITCKIEVLKD